MSQPTQPDELAQSQAVDRAFSIGMVTSAATAAVALIRSKVLALTLGPVGVGIAAEINQVVTLTTTPAGLAGGPTLVRAVSRARSTESARTDGQLAYDSALSIGLLGSLAAIPLAALIAHLTLPGEWADGKTTLLTCVAGVTAVFVLVSNVMAQVLIGAQQLRAHAFATIATSAVGVCLISAGAWMFGLVGVFGGTLVASILGVGIWLGSLARTPLPVAVRPSFRLDSGYVVDALRIGGAAFAGALGTQVSLYLVRSSLGRLEGPEANGLFQACWAIEGVFAQAVLTSLGNAIFPRYASASAGAELIAEMNQSARFLLRVVPPMMLAGVALRELALPLLYSREFQPAAPLLGLVFAGDIVRTMAWSRAGALLYRSHVRAYVLLQVLGAVLFGGGSVLLVPALGLIGVGWAFVGTYCVHTLLNQFVVRHELGVPIVWSNVIGCYVALALAVLSSLALDRQPFAAAVVLLAALIWAWRGGLLARVRARLFGRRRG